MYPPPNDGLCTIAIRLVCDVCTNCNQLQVAREWAEIDTAADTPFDPQRWENTVTTSPCQCDRCGSLDKPEDAVTLAVSFDSLPDGTNYPKETVLDAKAKQIQVKVSNSGHKK